MHLEHGRPADESGRQLREIRCYDLLEKYLPAVGHEVRMVTLNDG